MHNNTKGPYRMNKNTEGGDMKQDKEYTMKDAIKMYYGETGLSEADIEKIDERVCDMNKSGLKEKCQEIAYQKKKSIWRIGRLYVSKAACLVTLFCLIVAVGGFTLVRAYIKMLQVKDLGNHAEVEYLSEDLINGDYPKVIEEYFEPVWIPEGYRIYRTVRRDVYYHVEYRNNKGESILYMQEVLWGNPYYGAEKIQQEDIEFGKYSGELVIDGRDKRYYLIVTDGMYLYGIITSEIDKETIIKMFMGE